MTSEAVEASSTTRTFPFLSFHVRAMALTPLNWTLPASDASTLGPRTGRSESRLSLSPGTWRPSQTSTLQVGGRQRVLPVWHGLSHDDMLGYSPTLADTVAARTSDATIKEIAAEIARAVRGE